MGDLETPPYNGEIETDGFGQIPNPFRGEDVHTVPVIGETHTGPVRAFGVVDSPGVFGETSTGPCKGVMGSPPALGDVSTGP